MATGSIPLAQNLPISVVSAVRCEFQLVPASKRFLIWFYDSYTNSSSYHAYRLDLNGTAKTAKLEEIASGGAPTTLMTFIVS